MKVTLINTADAGGGAPEACLRLLKALKIKGVDARLIVQDKQTEDENVHQVNTGVFGKLKAAYNFYWERLAFILFKAADRTVRFAFSTAKTGTDISGENHINNADILHLHWTNQGFQSINNLIRLTRLGKPVVWTLHDMWAFTGGCHYVGDCDHFTHQCGHCWMLREPQAKDISYKGWLRKMHLFSDKNSVVFITCSNWLAGQARKSTLLKGYRIETIPNPIDTQLFYPEDKAGMREKWDIPQDKMIILFGAANITDRRKGITYLMGALDVLKATFTDEIEIVIFGKNKSFDTGLLSFKVHEVGVISNQQYLTELYSLADVYVTPAIEDNLPNTVMEAMACGTPVVAFNTGGIPDMVEHLQNGYLAELRSPVDFAAGITFVLNNIDSPRLGDNARKFVLQNFTNEIVAEKYMEVYRSLLA